MRPFINKKAGSLVHTFRAALMLEFLCLPYNGTTTSLYCSVGELFDPWATQLVLNLQMDGVFGGSTLQGIINMREYVESICSEID